jgi:hypothetical protein
MEALRRSVEQKREGAAQDTPAQKAPAKKPAAKKKAS